MNYQTSRIEWIEANLVTDAMVDIAIRQSFKTGRGGGRKRNPVRQTVFDWLAAPSRRAHVRRNIAIGINCGSYPTTPEMRRRLWAYVEGTRELVKA